MLNISVLVAPQAERRHARPVAPSPDDVTLVTHETPLIRLSPTRGPNAPAPGVRDACEANGSSAGMAAFIVMMP
jgi:hypothetical protein